MTGIEYPTVTVGSHENLVVRHSLAAQMLMRRRGIDPLKLGAAMLPNLPKASQDAPDVPNPDAVQNVLIVFSAMVAENFLDMSKPNRVDLNAVPTADYWASQVTDFGAVERAVWEALGKAVAERRAKLQAVPPPAESLAS